MPEICAIVVTYLPQAEVRDNLAAIRAQVDGLIVVDNGSSLSALQMLRNARQELSLTLMENGTNLGLAQALNLGIKTAADYDWVLLFDQDSRVRPGYVANMLACARAYPPQARASLFIPDYFDLRFKHRLPPILTADGSVAVAMTSGSLMRRSLVDQVGYFEDLFIYEIDYEFSLRLRKLGHTIQQCTAAVLDHSPAEPLAFTVFGKRLFYATNYKPVSRYYMHRNAIWMQRKYGKDFPDYFRFSRGVLLKDVLKMLLGEHQRMKKLRYILKGITDGLRGHMQPLNSD